MKRKIYLIAVGIIVLLFAGCGKTEQNESSYMPKENEHVEAIQEETIQKSESILLGVYEGATSYVAVPMGAYYEGAQTTFCKIDMPKEYIISASYSEDSVTEIVNHDIYGIEVKQLEAMGIESQNVANQWITITSTGGTKVSFIVLPTSIRTMEDEKTYAGEYQEINDEEHPAIYYVDSNEYATADLSMIYELNENMLLTISYEGTVAEEIGINQLAQNIYDLIEVIE